MVESPYDILLCYLEFICNARRLVKTALGFRLRPRSVACKLAAVALLFHLEQRVPDNLKREQVVVLPW